MALLDAQHGGSAIQQVMIQPPSNEGHTTASTPARPCLTCPPRILSFLQPPPRAMCGLRADKETRGVDSPSQDPWAQGYCEMLATALGTKAHVVSTLPSPCSAIPQPRRPPWPRMLQEGQGFLTHLELPPRPKGSKVVEEQGVYLSSAAAQSHRAGPSHVVGHGEKGTFVSLLHGPCLAFGFL